jgi:branched-subunit amino acid aminotransferase/4-amino-4-deoxychorismate lyase
VIGPTDRGLTLGDGLFETVLAEAGELRRLPAHLERMAQGCAALGLPAPDLAEADRLMRAALAGVSGRAAVRLTLTAGPGGRGLDRPQTLAPVLFATAAPAPKPEGAASLATSKVRRNEGSPASRLKTLAYLDNVLARREARANGADEALMLNSKGELAGAAAANLFWVSGGRLYTPHLDCGVLAGVTRARVIAAAAEMGEPVRAVRAAAEALKAAQGIFLTNSLIGLRPVSKLDGRRVQAWDGLAELERALNPNENPAVG